MEINFPTAAAVLCAALGGGVFAGLWWGWQIGRRRGAAEGRLEAPLALREQGLLSGRCPICSATAFGPADDHGIILPASGLHHDRTRCQENGFRGVKAADQ